MGKNCVCDNNIQYLQNLKRKKLATTMKTSKRFNKHTLKGNGKDELSEEYLAKRAKNNAAVKRARQKAKEKSNKTNQRIQSIKIENKELEERIKLLSAELKTMKDVYTKYTGEVSTC